MVKSTSKRKVEVKLVLNEEEATWLRYLLETAHSGHLSETSKDTKIRVDLYNTLSKELNLETKGPPKRPTF